MRCGRRGVAAAAGEPDLELVGRAGDRALADADLAEVEGRVAVQAEDLLDLVERVELDQRRRAAGHDLLGGLEQQPHAAGQLAAAVHLGQREAGADEAGGVHVVAAGVRDAGAGADPGVGGQVLDGQRVEVGPQRHPGTRVADVDDEAGVRQAGDRQAGELQPLRRRPRSCAARARRARGGRAGRGAARGARSGAPRPRHRSGRARKLDMSAAQATWSKAARMRSAAAVGGRSPDAHRLPYVGPDGRHGRRAPQPLLQLVAHQRPGELQPLVGPLGRQPVGAERLPVGEYLPPDPVDTVAGQRGAGHDGGGPGAGAPAVHQPQRAGELAGRGLGLLSPDPRRPC